MLVRRAWSWCLDRCLAPMRPASRRFAWGSLGLKKSIDPKSSGVESTGGAARPPGSCQAALPVLMCLGSGAAGATQAASVVPSLARATPGRRRQHPLTHRHVRDDVVDQVRRGLRHPPHTARQAEPTPLAAKRRLLVVAALTAAQPQEAVCQDAALEEGVELVLDKSRQLRAGAGLCGRDEAGCVLLDQAGQRGLLGAVALVVERGASGARWGCRPMMAGSRRPRVAAS